MSASKARGLREALRTLRLSEHNSVGVGDSENDHAPLATCELGVAVDGAQGVVEVVQPATSDTGR